MSPSLAQLSALHAELQALLTGARLQQLRAHGPARFSLELYGGHKSLLWLDLSRPHAACYLRDTLPPAVEPGALAMALRGQLIGARLEELALAPGDRILLLHWQGPESAATLVLELTGRHANLLLLNAGQQVQQLLYPDRSRRGLRRGQPYVLPDAGQAPERADPLDLAALPPDGSRSRRIESALLQTRRQAEQQQIAAQARAAIARRITRARQTLARLEQDLARLDEAGLWQRRGELLQGAYGQAQKGLDAITVIDYYAPDQAPVTIPLDPAKDLAANIQRCFQRARKLERAAERALDLIEPAEAEVRRLVALEQDLAPLFEAATSAVPDAVALDAVALARLRELIPPAPKQTRAAEPADKKPYREFSSKSGQRILVGRSAADNDALTFRHARGNDLWLHVRDWPGSHVVVPLNRGEAVRPETLLDAATLALHYSQVPEPESAEVAYTLRKHVQRFKGAKPGQVQLASFKTLSLRQDRARLGRLKGHPEPGSP